MSVPAEQDFAGRVRAIIERFGQARGLDSPVVEVEMRDKTRFRVQSISAEPGDGFVTFGVHPDEGVPGEIIVPVSAIVRFELHERDEPDRGFGFASS